MAAQSTNTNILTRSQGRKKSKFPADTGIPAGATFDFVSGGTNYKITLENLLLALNMVGTLSQLGEVTGNPVLDSQGTNHRIRNLVAGTGITITETALGGLEISLT